MTQLESPPTPPAGSIPPNGGSGSPPPAGSPPSGINEPWAKSWIQSDFTLDHKALDRLPDHLKGLRPTLERQKNFEGVLTALDHAQLVAGKKALAPLAADAPEAARNERKALLDTINGVPPNPKDYGISRPTDIPEGQWNQGLADNFVKWAHDNSVPPGAVKRLLDLQLQAVKGNLASQGQMEQQFWAAEQKTFAETCQRENINSDRASQLVEKGLVSLGLDMANEKTKRFMQGADARLMAMRHAIAIGEDRAMTGEGGGGGAGTDYAAQAHDIQRNPANPEYAVYRNMEQKFSRSQQDAVIAKVNRLHRMASEQAEKAAARGAR